MTVYVRSLVRKETATKTEGDKDEAGLSQKRE